MWSRLTALLLMLTLGLQSLPAADFDLKYTRTADDPSVYVPICSGEIKLQETAPPGITGVPATTGKNPIYGLLQLGDKPVAVLIDRQADSSAFYDRIRVDANGNMNLADDGAVVGKIQSSGDASWVEFGSADVSYQIGGSSLRYCVEPRLFCRSMKRVSTDPIADQIKHSGISGMMYVKCFYSADVTLDGINCRLVLADRNGNGNFAEPPTGMVSDETSPYYIGNGIFPMGDALIISDNGAAVNKTEQFVADRLLLGSRLYNFKVNMAVQKVSLEPYSGQLLSMSLPGEPEHLTIHGRGGKNWIAAFRPGKELMLPPDEYKLLSYHLIRKDQLGVTWDLTAQGVYGRPGVTVGGGQAAAMWFGEPFVPRAEIPVWSWNSLRSGGSCSLSFALRGVQNEYISNLCRTSTGTSMYELSQLHPIYLKEAAYKLFASDGRLVAQGEFKYG